ncbi:hypothetical protein SAY87_020236 [Trapa incisa]|uniref:RING-type domain-containing protein n=1 Tax=Trapa incisa TaxID=236973 RepID=A0AAN7K9H7_9MYRT|nr:hypothetical protein SAY87_020236 [Trapa incisa]
MPVHKRLLTESRADDGDSSQRRHHNLRHHGKQPLVDREVTSEEEEEEEEEEEHVRVEDEEEDHRKNDIKDEGEVKEGRDGKEDPYGETEGEDGEGQDSEDSQPSSSGDKSEFVYVDLSEIRKDVQCPICLGIIKKTRTVMDCLHRFCRECIDKSMRLGNNECPACRKHCASRRSLRDDPNFDALIAALYPDIDKYEEEELAFHEEEKTRNKEIQASIAQIFQRQIEALSKRRIVAKDTAAGVVPRPQRSLRTTNLRRKRNSRGTELNAYKDKVEDGDKGGKDSSSADEHSMEVRLRKKRKITGARTLMPSTSAEAECMENETEATRDNRGISPGLIWNPEMLAWGRGGTRSNTRHGGANGSSKNSRSTRLSRLTEHLRSLEETDEVDIHCILVSLDKKSAPDLKLPYFSSRSSLLVGHLSQYVALQTALQASEIEILVSKNISKQNLTHLNFKCGLPPFLDADLSKEELQLVEEKETLASIRAKYSYTHDHLVLAYRRKKNTAIS